MNLQMSRRTSRGWECLMPFSLRNLRKRSIQRHLPFVTNHSMNNVPLNIQSLIKEERRVAQEAQAEGAKGGQLIRRCMCYWGIHRGLPNCPVTIGYPESCWERRSGEKLLRFNGECPGPESCSCMPPLLNSSHPRADQNQRSTVY